MRRITLLTNPDVCNLHCLLCFRRQQAHSFRFGSMTIETAKAAIKKYAAERDASGKRILREVIPSTMGEPLLYSKFEELLDFCETTGIKLNLTTNGTFPGKWGTPPGMEKLLAACIDIKISTLSYEMGGFSLSKWRENVEQLLDCRQRQKNSGSKELSTVSRQVTLHRENLDQLEPILHWAESIGIHRIKWNPVVILDSMPQEIRTLFELDNDTLSKLRQEFQTGSLHSKQIKNEGSLFLENATGDCPMAGDCSHCPFKDEAWIWPDGHEDHCPNPRRRWNSK